MKKRLWMRWYPRSWRARYGEEYEQLLEDLASEQKLSWRGELDVVQSGISLRRLYPDGWRRRLLMFGSALVIAVLGFVVGFGIHGESRSVVSIGFVGGNRPVAIRQCLAAGRALQRVKGGQVRISVICKNAAILQPAVLVPGPGAEIVGPSVFVPGPNGLPVMPLQPSA